MVLPKQNILLHSPSFPPSLKQEGLDKGITYKMQVTHFRPCNDGSRQQWG